MKSRTQVLKLRRGSTNASIIRAAARAIKHGGVAVFPTDTVYGIGANALDASACAKVYGIKGRERGKALIVLVSDMRMLGKVASIPKRHVAALEKIWPAPLTVIARAKAPVPGIIKAGDKTVAVRIPDSKIVLELIKAANVPIVAPSANPSGIEPAKTGAQAKRYFDGKVDVILDSGRSMRTMPSTIIRLRDMRILRQGAFPKKQLDRAFGKPQRATTSSRRRRRV